MQISCISILNFMCAVYYFVALPYMNLSENIKNGFTEIVFIIIHILVSILKTDDKHQVEIDRI